MAAARFRHRLVAVLVTLGVLCSAAAPAGAEPVAPSAEGAMPFAPAKIVETVGIDQNLGGQVPLDLTFRDEAGRTVALRDYFAKGKPVVISLVYYGCPGLCGMTLSGMSRSFKPLAFTPGDEFEVVTVSFDPSEQPALAAEKKATYVKEYGRPQAAKGWHFLTGDKQQIDELCKAVGFRYAYDPATKQYAHATALMVATPNGKLAKYFYGMEYSARDLRLGIVEAADERIGSVSDTVVLLCFQYDPHTGKYSWAVMKTLKLVAGLLVAVMGSFLFFMIRRERRFTAATLAAEAAGHTGRAASGDSVGSEPADGQQQQQQTQTNTHDERRS